jgi:serine/threonine protein kinase
MGSRALANMPALGEVVAGRYRLDAVIGAGGMGCVFKAEHVNMGKTVALKMLSLDDPDEAALRRFRLEAKLASQLSHPNIVAITDFDIDEQNRPFIVMDYLRGRSLERVLRDEPVLGVERFAHIMTQACRALGYAHKSGLIHRDVKLSNLMLVDRGGEKDVLMIVDFGLVEVSPRSLGADPASWENSLESVAGQAVGSPLFMSPEQCCAQMVDARSDIYSLGCVMYRCLTGEMPFVGDGKTVRTIFQQQVEKAPVPFADIDLLNKCPASVERVVMKALAKKPEDRQQDMQQLAEEIADALKKRSVLDEVNLKDLSRNASFMNTMQIRKFKVESSNKPLIAAVAAAVAVLFFWLYQTFGHSLPSMSEHPAAGAAPPER